MAVARISLTLPPDLAEHVRREAEMSGSSVSAWIEQAVRRALRIQAGLTAVDAHEREHGRPSPEVLADADRILDSLFGSR